MIWFARISNLLNKVAVVDAFQHKCCMVVYQRFMKNKPKHPSWRTPDAGGSGAPGDGIAARSPLERLPEGLADAAWLWLVLRVSLGLFAAALFVKGGLPGPCHFELALNGWTTFPPLDDKGIAFPLVGVWQRWDACWYSKIAVYGYEPGISSTAFFPLLPVLMRAGSALTGGDVALAGLIVNAIALVVALTGLWQLVRADFDAELARRTLLYVVIFPSAFFLFAPFTEAIFLACAVWAVHGARRRYWKLAALAGLLGALARTQGLLLVLPLGWEAATALRERWSSWRSGIDRPRIGDLDPLIAAAAPVVAFAGFIWYTGVFVGQTPFDAQAMWGNDWHLPWETVIAAWNWAIERPDVVEMINLVALLLFAYLFFAGIWRLPASYTLYVLPHIMLVSVRLQPTPLTSTTRFMLVLFPAFIVLAMAGRRPRLHTAWVTLSLLFLGLLTALFLEGNFVA